MRLNTRSLLACVALLVTLSICYSIFHSLLSKDSKNSPASSLASLEEISAIRQRNLEHSFRLESWGECFQAAPNLLVAVASNQLDRPGRNRLRKLWRKKWRISAQSAHLMFFVRYSRTASRDRVVEEFHRHQDLMLNAALDWQTDAAMLGMAASWYQDRCPRTPYLLFVGADSGNLDPNVRLVALHTAGGGVRSALHTAGGGVRSALHATASVEESRNSTAAEQRFEGVTAASRLEQNGTITTANNVTKPKAGRTPPCLLLNRTLVGTLVSRLRGSEADWAELKELLQPEFNGWSADATRLFCRLD